MSETIATARDNVYELLQDTDPFNNSMDPVTLAHIIVDRAQALGARVGYGPQWLTTAFTLSVASQADYTLASGFEYHQVLELRMPELGRLLRKTSRAAVDRIREGLKSDTGSTGDPTWFAVWEDQAQATRIRIDTIPSVARTVDALVTRVAVTSYTDATVLPFSDTFLRVIEKDAALRVLAMLTKEERSRLRINPEIAELWSADIRSGIRSELERKSRIRGSSRAPSGDKASIWV
jgi:hypothetical protein